MKTVKRTKKVTKKTTKQIKPAFIVDATCATDSRELQAAMAVGKADAGLDVSAEEFIAYSIELIEKVDVVERLIHAFVSKLTCTACVEKKRGLWERIKYLFTGK